MMFTPNFALEHVSETEHDYGAITFTSLTMGQFRQNPEANWFALLIAPLQGSTS